MDRSTCRWTTCISGLAGACLSISCGETASARADATVTGVYANGEGSAWVALLTDGRAHFSLHNVGGSCTYARTGRSLDLTCEGETTRFTVEDDGTLTGPPDSFLTRLKKKS